MRHETVQVNYRSSLEGLSVGYKLSLVCKNSKIQFTCPIPYITAGEFLGQHESKSQDVSNVGLCFLVPGHIE